MSQGTENPFGDNPYGGATRYGGMPPMPTANNEGDATGGVMQNPAVKGAVHAWIGIVMGGIFTLVWGAMWIVGIIGMIANVTVE